MDIYTVATIILAFLFILLGVFILVLFQSEPYPEIKEFTEESHFINVQTKEKEKFPSFRDPPTRTLSVIVPAYNEEERLPPMLDECLGYLEDRTKDSAFTYEVLIVDDGSSDSTSKIGLDYAAKYSSDKIRVLTLTQNRGKGGAVRLGMMRSRGELLLFADADGATKFSDYNKLETEIKKLCAESRELSQSLAVVCGSRAHLEEESVATRSFFRTVLMYGFHFLVWLFTVRSVKDTQCGFKLLTRRSARILFSSLHVERWAFDVEMLYMSESLGIPIGEVAVTWTEIDGSKVTPVISWLQMGRDILIIWMKYAFGLWKIRGE